MPDIFENMSPDIRYDYCKKNIFDKIFNNYQFKILKNFVGEVFLEIDEIVNFEEKKLCNKWTILNTKLKNGLILDISICYEEELDWITFHFKNESITLEKVEFMLLKNNEHDFNKIIRHDYFIVDNDIATTFNSSYTFIDNKYKDGLEQRRKVKFNDIKRYAGKDNLANFAVTIDSSKNEILYKDDKTNLEISKIDAFFLNNECIIHKNTKIK